MGAEAAEEPFRQLIESRISGGLSIMRLHGEDGSSFVQVSGPSDSFTLRVMEGDDPNEVFQHPFAYQAFYGLKNAALAECDRALAEIDREEARTIERQRQMGEQLARRAMQVTPTQDGRA